MDVEFRLTEADLVANYRATVWNTVTERRKRAGYALAAIGIPLLLIMPSVAQAGTMSGGQIAIVAGSLVFVVALTMYWRRAPERIVAEHCHGDENPGLFEPQRMRISEEGFELRSQGFEGHWAWRLVRSITHTEQFFYIHVSDTWLLVPRRDFDSDDAFNAFVCAASRWRDAAPNFETTCPECQYRIAESPIAGCPECGWRRADG